MQMRPNWCFSINTQFVQRPFVARHPPFQPYPNMCDNAVYTLQSSVLILALSAIPSTIVLYTILALVCASFVIYAAHHELPSTRLIRLNNVITAVKDILARAKSECLRDHLVIAYEEEDLIRVIDSPFMIRVELSMSNIQTGLLEARDAPWTIFIHKMWTIWHSLDKCERKVREIQKSLLLILEAEHHRKLAENLNESREAVNAVVQSPKTPKNRRRGQGTVDGPINSRAALNPSRISACEGRRFDTNRFPEHITQRVEG
ncbi:hypothetical protein B0H17DRAFT_1031989 [Mycena rosella]|uniref:Uncharacterized protein n=1 Tax=Mycena rosella TaxID=1033263 RepID=A0AAD7MAR5_MYCRO|nr:hypothetical protein B0H17DRAFT_1031989 [Mycena rosella]